MSSAHGGHAGSVSTTPLGYVLVVDDDPALRKVLTLILERAGFAVRVAASGAEALGAMVENPVEVILTDVQMPGIDGLELLPVFRSRYPQTEVIVMTGYATVERAITAMKKGAYDFLTKPFEDVDLVARIVSKALEKAKLRSRANMLERALDVQGQFEELVGSSDKMKSVYEMIDFVAYADSHVLVRGESGTGKELVARALHYRSSRKEKPFVVVNCSALTETLLESELFGHVQGAFTGAIHAKKGLFEAAHRGTLFLDEIGDISPMMQVKILRAIQSGEIKPVGSTEVRNVDVRVITATHRDLVSRIAEGLFREDLYYRINVIELNLPPLRDRREDIPLLAFHFLKRLSKKMGKEIARIQPEVLSLLGHYSWPGNVRELENVMERALVLERSTEIQPQSLPPHFHEGQEPLGNEGIPSFSELEFKAAKALAVGQFEKVYVTTLLGRCAGNVSEASRAAKMDRSNFRRLMKKYSLEHS